jgi:hypothetical protein
MQFTADGLIASVGQYGPFKDGTTYPYVDFVASDGSGIYRATVGQGVDTPGALTSGTATIEVHRRDDGGLRLRLLAFKVGAKQLASAA